MDGAAADATGCGDGIFEGGIRDKGSVNIWRFCSCLFSLQRRSKYEQNKRRYRTHKRM